MSNPGSRARISRRARACSLSWNKLSVASCAKGRRGGGGTRRRRVVGRGVWHVCAQVGGVGRGRRGGAGRGGAGPRFRTCVSLVFRRAAPARQTDVQFGPHRPAALSPRGSTDMHTQ